MKNEENNKGRLTTDLISHPLMYRMGLMVTSTSVDVVITSRVNDNGLLFRHIDFPAGADPMTALEETVYDNPLLTSDFYEIYVLVDNNRFFAMDAVAANENEIRKRIELLWPEDKSGVKLEALVTPAEQGRNVVVGAASSALLKFLRRTFNNPAVEHRMGVLTRYYAVKNRLGNMGKIHVRLGEETTDILVFGHQGLLLVNTYPTKTTDDAAYFTLAVAKQFDFDNENDRIYVTGDGEVRDAYMAEMRRFVNMVLPEIMPTELTAPSSETGKVPFELLAYPLVSR